MANKKEKTGDEPKNKGGRPSVEQTLVRRIRNAEKVRLNRNIEWFEDLNKRMPVIMQKMSDYADGQLEISVNEFRACQWLYEKWSEMSVQLSKSADKVEETFSPKEKVVGKDGNVTKVEFSQFAPQE